MNNKGFPSFSLMVCKLYCIISSGEGSSLTLFFCKHGLKNYLAPFNSHYYTSSYEFYTNRKNLRWAMRLKGHILIAYSHWLRLYHQFYFNQTFWNHFILYLPTDNNERVYLIKLLYHPSILFCIKLIIIKWMTFSLILIKKPWNLGYDFILSK